MTNAFLSSELEYEAVQSAVKLYISMLGTRRLTD
jgi:hypothetical protein